MPFSTVRLRPGVTTQLTQAQNEAGISTTQLVRFHDGLIQKLGGWQKYINTTFSSTIRELHAWQGLTSNKYLGVGTTGSGGTQALVTINGGTVTDITPQTRLSSGATFSASNGSSIITVIDNGSSASVFDVIYFNTPVSVGSVLLNGAYQIQTVGGSSTYTITASAQSTFNVTSSGILPVFTATAGSAIVTVTLPHNNFLKVTGTLYTFTAPTTLGGNLTIQGPYQVYSIIDSTSFTILTKNQASSNDSQTMNNNTAQLNYYVTQGPASAGGGWGTGGWGLGGWGMGAGVTTAAGTNITATDWSIENWGELILCCPENGPVYVWDPLSSFQNASVIPQAPFANGGLFISQPQQILVCWASTQTASGTQDPLVVRWSDSGDYTSWTPTSLNQAGSFHLASGSKIVGGLQAGLKGIIWTELDCWVMQWVGQPDVFNFTQIGTGCGLVGRHARADVAEKVFWMGLQNFFTLTDDGIQVIPCPVWDAVFQNINTSFLNRVFCAANSNFSEVSWFYPSLASTGENDSYVKYNFKENVWDYGSLVRTSWTDQTILGNPIGTDLTSIYQHELTNDSAGMAIGASFESGFWTIADGEQMSFVDWLLPDMKFGFFGQSQNASVQVTLKALDYVGATPRTYGPFIFTSSTQYLNPRLRGRFMSIQIQSNDTGSFWRIGAVKYRWAPAGRR